MKAVGDWLSIDAQRELSLFRPILADDRPADPAWLVGGSYQRVTGTGPTDVTFNWMLAAAAGAEEPSRRKRLLSVASFMTSNRNAPRDAHWKVLEALRLEGDMGDVIEVMTVQPFEPYQIEQMQRRIADREELDRNVRNNIEKLTPVANRLAAGDPSEFGALVWGADHFIGDRSRKWDVSDALGRVAKLSTAEIASAIAEGWSRFTAAGNLAVDTAALGRIEARHSSYRVERVVAGRLLWALHKGSMDAFAGPPLSIPIIALREGRFFQDETRDRLATWSLDRLSEDVEAGASELVTYWHAALDEGDEDLDNIHFLLGDSAHRPLAKAVATSLLRTRPGMPPRALNDALQLALQTLTLEEIDELARRAGLRFPTIPSRARPGISFDYRSILEAHVTRTIQNRCRRPSSGPTARSSRRCRNSRRPRWNWIDCGSNSLVP